MLATCEIGLDGIFFTDCARAYFITALPACLAVLPLLLWDILAVVGFTKLTHVRRFLEFLGRPFENFLQLEDLDEFEGAKAAKRTVPAWKVWSLKALLGVEVVVSIITTLVSGLNWRTNPLTLAHGLVTLCWVCTLLRTTLRPPSQTSYTLTLLACLTFLSSLINTYHYSTPSYLPPHVTSLPLSMLSVISALLSFSLLILALSYPMTSVSCSPRISPLWIPPSNKLSSPEDNVSLWNWITFNYITPLLDRAGEGTLNEEDVWDLPPGFKHANLFRKFLKIESEYNKEAKPKDKKMSLLWFLIWSNSQDLLIDLGIKTLLAFAGFIPPYSLSRILSSLENHSSAEKSHTEAYFWALITFLAHMSFAQLALFQGWHSRRAYERTRGQLFCVIHWKALCAKDVKGKIGRGTGGKEGEDGKKEKEKEKQSGGIGRITNLMSGDAYAVAQRFWEFSAVFTAPIQIAISLTFLYKLLGWSSFAGVSVVLLAYAITQPLAKWSIRITRSSWAAKDYRMALVSELLQSVRFLKYMGWEAHWTNKVKKAREVELAWRVKENIVSSIIAFLWTWIPSAVILASFASYTLLAGHQLTVSKAFVSIEVFSHLQGPMSDLPNQIFALLHASVSMGRIQGYLSEEEVEAWASSIKMDSATRGEADSGEDNEKVGFTEAAFRWHASESDKILGSTAGAEHPSSTSDHDAPNIDKSASTFLLGHLTITFPVGRLSLVTGPTGSGKTSLLSALLGEMDRISGEVHLRKGRGKVAYAGQFAFLEHATVRDNIIYHERWDKDRYEIVLEACALKPDLKILDAGDRTEIGEKGVSLSGGQRARIALARAMYSRSKVVLLDDPLAAVDMHTARHLFEHCLSPDAPLIKGRTVILVTHHVSLCLPATAYLLELDRGRVLRQGSVEELRKKGQLAHVIEAEDVSQAIQKEGEEQTEKIIGNVADGEDRPPLNSTAETATSVTAEDTNMDADAGKLVDAEARAEGRVSFRTYLLYVKSAGWFSWALTFLLLISIRVVTVGQQLYIARWANAYRTSIISLFRSASRAILSGSHVNTLPSPSDNVTPWLLIYLGLSLVGAFATLAYIVVGYVAGLRASRVLFVQMLDRVVRAPTRFFDKTPTGRILNRFVADIAALDNALNSSARSAVSGTLTFIISFGVIVYIVPVFTPFATFIAIIYIWIAPPFVRAARDLRRLESISLSPAFSGFDELLHGLAHVRAFGMERVYQERFYTRVDMFQTMDHVYWLAQMWLRYRYDVLGSVVVYLTTLFALWSGVGEGLAAVVIVQAGVFAEASRQLVRVLAQAELDFNSVERIKEYLEVPQEAPARVPNPPPAAWPSSEGGIVVEDLVVRYAPTLPAVLRGITFSVRPREKVGVVGRTGSGKSTLALALLRIVEAERGRITLDGIDISTVGLDDVREHLTIVSQDVSLFSGTVQSNLDPLSEHTEAECWDVLERCHLVEGLPYPGAERKGAIKRLDMEVSAGGSSFSAGERQLLALARAMLRQSNFIILDEASSSIDLATDDQIQRTIREEMKHSLVLTIAHRLKTILDYDRILVLGDGNILEYDTPSALLAIPNGVFKGMCERSADWEELKAAVGVNMQAKLI